MATKKINRSWMGTALIAVVVCLFSVFFLLPILFMITHAFAPLDEIFRYPPPLFPSHPTLDNFTAMFQQVALLWVPFSRYIFNSVIVSVLGTAFSILISCMCAYPLAKVKFKGKKLVNESIVYALLFVAQIMTLPQYIILAKLGLLNTYFAVLFPLWTGTMGVFLMRQFMSQLPDDILEAAEVDGANMFSIFWRVVMPNMKPALMTLIIFTFVPAWSTTAATTSSSVLFSENMKLLPTVLQTISAGGMTAVGASAAAALFVFIPPLLLFIFLQSQVMETMAYSGIKA